MKAVIGIGEKQQTRDVLSLVNALRFPNADVHLVHVLEQITTLGWSAVEGVGGAAIARLLEVMEADAKKNLQEAKNDWEKYGQSSQTHLLQGLSANQLLDFAKRSSADMLCLGSSGLTPVRAAILGSVSRKAVISSDSSVLIAKKSIESDRRLTAVLATDHSEYSHSCLKKFQAFAPAGINKLVVTTVFPEQLVRTASALVQNFKADVGSWIKSELATSNQKVIDNLRIPNCEMKSRVESGSVNESLALIMREEKADLLILGAQGHGFIERLAMGSIAMHQAFAEDYSIMIVRA